MSQSVRDTESAAFEVVASSATTMTYQWLKNGANISGATQSAYTIANVQTNHQGTYTVKVTNAGGSVTSSGATLTVNVPPAITTQPASQTVIAGQNASFSVAATGTPAPSYRWRFNGTNLSGATASVYTRSSAQPAHAGSYTVVVTNVAGAVTSAVATLTVLVPPGITTQPQSASVTWGMNTSFSVVASGDAPLSFQWRWNGAALPGATGSALALNNVQPADAGSYTVMVVNPWGSVTSAVATLTVNVPPAITTQPESETVIAGQNASFSVAATGTPAPSYGWRFNGMNLSGATASVYTRSSAQPAPAGSYTVVVTNVAGAVTSAVATLTVLVPPGITTQPRSVTVTRGMNTSFSVVASGDAPLSFQWQWNGAALPGATGSALALNNVQPADAGSYTVRVVNPWGSVTSAVATLTVNVPPAITTQPASQTVIVGQNASFSVVATGTPAPSYQWRFNGTNLSGATLSVLAFDGARTRDVGAYTVVVTNLLGAVTSAVATLTITNPPTAFSAAGMQPDGFLAQLSVPIGWRHVVQASTNLQDWVSIFTDISELGTVAFLDPTAASYPSRFYRAWVDASTAILQQNTSGADKMDVKLGQAGAQSFRHGVAGDPRYSIHRIVLGLSRDLTAPNANLKFTIGTGMNSGALARSTVAISPSTITNTTAGFSFQTYEIVYEAPVGPLTAEQTYYLNLECQAGNGKGVYVKYDSNGTYANGTYYKQGSNDGKDMWFEIWGQ